MDPVSAGSSVLAFVFLALNSTKAIHGVLSAVKDGPQSLRHLVGDIAQLQGILERLSSLQSESISDVDAGVLESAARRCADDVAQVESKLQRLRIRPTDRHVGKLWKRLLTAVSEKDLTQMQGLVRGHFIMLSAQLSLSQTVRISASQSQLSEMHKSLKQIQEQVSVLGNNLRSAATTSPPLVATPTDMIVASNTPRVPVIDLELEQGISRIFQLIGEKESTVQSHEAQQMIEDLEALLQAAEREESKTENRSWSQGHQGQKVSGELKLIRRLIAAAPTFAVNGTGMGITSSIKTRSDLTHTQLHPRSSCWTSRG